MKHILIGFFQKIAKWIIHRPYTAILIVGLIAFFQVVMGIFILKWDNLSVGFINSNYISQCIDAGYFPYWNPYLYLGAPVFSNLAARFHFLWSWIMIYTTGYSIWSLHIEFILTYIMTGWGMFSFLSSWYSERKIILMGAIIFMLSGGMIGHAQHLSIGFSMMCFPWFLFFITKILRDGEYRFALLLGIFANWALTGGYPGINFIAFYVCAFYVGGLVYYTKSYRRVGFLGVGILVFLLLSLPYLYCLYIHKDQIGRMGSIPLDSALWDPLSPISLFSFFQPGFIISDSTYFQNDLSMRNVYMGILTLPLVAYALIYVRTKRIILLTILSLFFLSAALGKFGFTREILYHYVPLMNYFRFSSLFRFFLVSSILMILMESLIHLSKTDSYYKLLKNLKYYAVFYSIGMSFCVLILIPDTSSLHRFLEITGVVLITQAIVYSILVYGLKTQISPFGKSFLLLFMTIVDLIAVTQIMSPVLVYDRKKSVYEFQSEYQKHNRGFDYIANLPLKNYSSKSYQVFEGRIDNNTVWLKQPTVEGYNPCKPNIFKKLMLKHDPRNQPIVFSSDTHARIDITKIYPNGAEAIVKSDIVNIVSIAQNYFEGWRVSVDSIEVPLVVKDYMPSVVLKPGHFRVHFQYEKKEILYLHYFQMIASIVVILVFIVWSRLKLRANVL